MSRFLVFLLFLVMVSESHAFQISNQDRSLITQQMKSAGKTLNLSDSFGVATKYLGDTKANESKGNIEKFLLSLIKAEIASQSKFKSKIIDLSELEAVWEKSVEFNNTDFEEIYAQANFSHILIANYMIYEGGLEFNFDVFQTDGEAIGRSVFTSKQIMLDIPWEKYQEAQLLSPADAEDLRIQVEQLTKMNSIIEKPKLFEEFYANYVLYLRSGDELQAAESLAAAIKLKPVYVDLVDDVTSLARSAFGADGAQDFLGSNIYPSVSRELQHYSKLQLDPNFNIFSLCDLDTHRLDNCKIEVDDIATVPLLNLFLKVQGERFQTNSKNWGIDEIRQYNILQSSRAVIESFKTGSFSDFYFDKLRAKAEIDIALAIELEAKYNTARYDIYQVKDYVLGSAPFIALPADSKGKLKVTKQNCIGPTCQSFKVFNWKGLEFFSPTKNKSARVNRDTFAALKPVGGMIGGAYDIIDFLGAETLGPCQSARSGIFQGSVTDTAKEKAEQISFFWSVDERAKAIELESRWIPMHSANEALAKDKISQMKRQFTKLPVLDWSERKSLTSLFDASYQPGNKIYNQLVLPNEFPEKRHLGNFLNAGNDRLLWADFCAVNLRLAGSPTKVFIEKEYKGIPTFDFQILGNLYITDNVDTTKPIIISTYGRFRDQKVLQSTVEWSVTDISIDGTLFDPNGLNLDATQFIRGIGSSVLHKNRWLSAPGFLQSSIGMHKITNIEYTDIYGNKKIVIPTVGNELSVASQVASSTVKRSPQEYSDPVFPSPSELYQANKDRSDELYAMMGAKPKKLFQQMKYHFDSLSEKGRLAAQTILLMRPQKNLPMNLELKVWTDTFEQELMKFWKDKNFDYSGLSFEKNDFGNQKFIKFLNDYLKRFSR